MDDFHIQYQGFSPTEFSQDYIRHTMEKLYDEAPSSSALRVSIVKSGDRLFKGYIKISSHAGHFFIQAANSTLVGLTHQLLNRTRRKLEKWRHKRFSKKNFNFSEAAGEKYEDPYSEAN